MSQFDKFRAMIKDMGTGETDAIRESRPNETAITSALMVLKVAEGVGLQPTGVAASHAGSVIVHFENSLAYTDIEAGNEGGLDAVITMKCDSKPDVWPVTPDEADVTKALGRIKKALGYGKV